LLFTARASLGGCAAHHVNNNLLLFTNTKETIAMETRKLFYEDSHLTEFTATVTACEAAKGGWVIQLDATAFYPEGGGQACDLGILGNAKVLDVQEKEGKILHFCDKELEIGQGVSGQVDWARRFDLMQQHSGEHIVSGIICSRYGYHNVGFHVGSDRMEIDFDGPVPADDLVQIEHLANEAVWRNLPIRCWYPSAEELPTVPYRSKKALDWPVRIVEIPGVDDCACCGVHVKNTGEIGLIKLISCAKFHSGVRIEMSCGNRALALTQAVFAQNKIVSQVFSAKMLETGTAAIKMNEQLSAEKLRANTLQTQLLRQTAQGYQNAGNVTHFEENLDGGQLRELTDAIAKVCGGRAAVFSGSGENWNICMLQPGGDLSPVIARLKAAFPTRGGGKPGTFQGTVQASRQQIEALFADPEA
jgi:alanyl-tRNA synthetase